MTETLLIHLSNQIQSHSLLMIVVHFHVRTTPSQKQNSSLLHQDHLWGCILIREEIEHYYCIPNVSMDNQKIIKLLAIKAVLLIQMLQILLRTTLLLGYTLVSWQCYPLGPINYVCC